MSHDNCLAQFRVQNAIGAFDRKQLSALGRHGGVKRTSLFGTRQKGLRFRGARKQSPQYILRRTLSPFAFRQPHLLPSFGVGKHNLARLLQKNQNRQCVQNLPLSARIHIFRKVQTTSLPGNLHRSHSRLLTCPVHWSLCSPAALPQNRRPRAARLPSPKPGIRCNQSPENISLTHRRLRVFASGKSNSYGKFARCERPFYNVPPAHDACPSEHPNQGSVNPNDDLKSISGNSRQANDLKKRGRGLGNLFGWAPRHEFRKNDCGLYPERMSKHPLPNNQKPYGISTNSICPSRRL